MKIVIASLVVLTCGTLSAGLVEASILVKKGKYLTPALVYIDEKGVARAIFNLRSLSELRIKLIGKLAKKLANKKSDGYLIGMLVKDDIQGNQGEAELISVSPLQGQKIPLMVGNGFTPIKTRFRY